MVLILWMIAVYSDDLSSYKKKIISGVNIFEAMDITEIVCHLDEYILPTYTRVKCKHE